MRWLDDLNDLSLGQLTLAIAIGGAVLLALALVLYFATYMP